MPNFSGFDFIKTLKDPPTIIVTTSDKNFAFEAFEYDFIIDYLVKPITSPRFLKAIHKLESLEKKTSIAVSEPFRRKIY